MKKNMGLTDRIIRIGIVLVIGMLYLDDIISGVLALVLGILALVFLLTSLVGFCPLYTLFGINSARRKVNRK